MPSRAVACAGILPIVLSQHLDSVQAPDFRCGLRQVGLHVVQSMLPLRPGEPPIDAVILHDLLGLESLQLRLLHSLPLFLLKFRIDRSAIQVRSIILSIWRQLRSRLRRGAHAAEELLLCIVLAPTSDHLADELDGTVAVQAALGVRRLVALLHRADSVVAVASCVCHPAVGHPSLLAH